MAKRFPKKLFVKVEESDPDFFVADDDTVGFVEVGQKVKVAVYQLVEIGEIEGVARSTFKKRR